MDEKIHDIGRYAHSFPPKHTVFKIRKFAGFICQYGRKQILFEELFSTALDEIPKEPPSVIMIFKTADSVQKCRIGRFFLESLTDRCRSPPIQEFHAKILESKEEMPCGREIMDWMSLKYCRIILLLML